jgi:hypothetical protein
VYFWLSMMPRSAKGFLNMEEVGLEIQKAALAQNARALYNLMGNHGKAGS